MRLTRGRTKTCTSRERSGAVDARLRDIRDECRWCEVVRCRCEGGLVVGWRATMIMWEARAQGETTRMLAFLFLFMIIIRGRGLNSKKVRMRVELRAYMKGQERKEGPAWPSCGGLRQDRQRLDDVPKLLESAAELRGC